MYCSQIKQDNSLKFDNGTIFVLVLTNTLTEILNIPKALIKIWWDNSVEIFMTLLISCTFNQQIFTISWILSVFFCWLLLLDILCQGYLPCCLDYKYCHSFFSIKNGCDDSPNVASLSALISVGFIPFLYKIFNYGMILSVFHLGQFARCIILDIKYELNIILPSYMINNTTLNTYHWQRVFL